MKKFLLAALVVFTFSTLMNAQENAPSIMQLGKLTESNGVAGDGFGSSIAVSGDTAVINRSYNITDGEPMAVDVFVKGPNGWGNMTPVATLTSSDGQVEFGAVAISGNTALAGGYDYSTLTNGVYIFVKPSGGWAGTITETAVLGYAGAIGISGNTVVIGGENIYEVFVKPAGGWKSTSSPNATLMVPFANFTGGAMAVSGSTVVVGESENFGNEGTVYVYSKPAGGWSSTLNPTATLLASNSHQGDLLGSGVAVSGNTIAAIAVGAKRGLGAAYVFVEPSGGWVDMNETAELTATTTTGLSFHVAASGNAVVIGAPSNTVGFNQYQGAVYLYIKPAGGWKTTSTPTAELVASDGETNDQLGATVAVSGSTVLAAAPFAMIGSNYSEGAAYVFGK